MNLSEQLNLLHEGGLVSIPLGLQKLVTGGAKHVVMGQVIEAVNSVIKQYGNVLSAMDKKHPNYKDIEKIIKMLEKYVKAFKAFKPRKSNVRNKKIHITTNDMKPYTMPVGGFDILLTTGTSSKKGTRGHITTTKGNDGFHSEIPLNVNFARIGGTIDVFKSFAKNATTLHMMMRDGKPLDDMSLRMLNDIFPTFKKFTKNIRSEMADAISILRHELTHVVQFQTGQGFNHSDFNKEGGYIQYNGKAEGSFDKYSVGSKEIKAYLLNQVDDFYKRDFKGMSYSDAIKSFVSDRVWFNAFKDNKKRKTVIRDFTIATEKDRRKKGFEKPNLSESLLDLHEKKKDPYKVYEYPISVSDMKEAYKRLNKELFGGKLPDVRLKFAPLAKNFFGKYHHVYDVDGEKAKDRLITMASVTRKDNKQFEDTLIHEMIHVWQYWTSEKTGTDKYLDDEGFTGMGWFLNPEKDKHKRGHGEFFHSEMKRVNKLGYGVRTESDMQIEKELISPVWVIIFHSSTEKGVFVYSVKDPKNKMDTIIASIEEVAGTGFFTSYTIIKTTDTVANTGLRLTKEFILPKNSVNIFVASQKAVTVLVKSKLSTLVGGNDIAPSGEQDQSVSPEETQLLQQMHKWRGGDFKSYLVTFINNTPKYSSLITTDAYKANNWGSHLSMTKWKYPDEIKGIPKEVVEAVRKDWVNVSDVDIKKAFKFASTEIRVAISSEDKKIKSNYIKNIQSKFDNDFKGRVSMDKFKSIFYKVVLSDIKKVHKKFNQPFDAKAIEQVIRQVILKGTILEQNLTEQIRTAIAEGIQS